MRVNNILVFVTFAIMLMSGCKSQKGKFEFLSPKSGETLILGEKVAVRMQFPDSTLDSVVYSIDGHVIERKQDTTELLLDTESIGLGARNLVAKLYWEGKEVVAFSNVTILPESPRQYTFQVVNEYPHDTTAFTQGLEFENGFLYESTGAGNDLITSLRKVELTTGRVLQKKEITGADASGEPYFGEGMTIVGDKIVMLTWRNKLGYVFNKNTFEQVGTFNYQQSTQGWGLCYDGKRLIKTDSSNKLYFLDPNTYQEIGFISVYDHNGAVDYINELEYIDGKVYANIYGKDIVVIINPETGVVEGQINFVGLYKNAKRHAVDEEMNGIAYDKENKRFFVTGKQWTKLYEVKIIAR
ncbi:glutaminyl-peptide cyclotransferase [Sphingobacterium micropteri]|nr:glutaminyl-peptide cyclotransferase [Sphingobacterium micropteri]